MKNVNVEVSMDNVRKYLLGAGRHNCVAEMLGKNEKGFLCEVVDDRTYYEKIRVDQLAELVIIEVFPGIHCENCYRSQFFEHTGPINNRQKCGEIKLSDNGDVYLQIAQSIKDAPVSVKTIELLEQILLIGISGKMKNLERVCHGHLPLEEKENPFERIIRTHFMEKEREEDWENDDDKEMKELVESIKQDLYELEKAVLDSDEELNARNVSMEEFASELMGNGEHKEEQE